MKFDLFIRIQKLNGYLSHTHIPQFYRHRRVLELLLLKLVINVLLPNREALVHFCLPFHLMNIDH